MKKVSKTFVILLRITFMISSISLAYSQASDQSGKASTVDNQWTINNLVGHGTANFNIDRIVVTDSHGVKWFPGKEVGSDIINKSNTVVFADIADIHFGPLDGYINGELKVAWNNRNRIIYIEVLSSEVETADGITLGTSKSEVRGKMGVPFIQNQIEDWYDNNEYEFVGISFKYDTFGLIYSIVLYTYV